VTITVQKLIEMLAGYPSGTPVAVNLMPRDACSLADHEVCEPAHGLLYADGVVQIPVHCQKLIRHAGQQWNAR